MGRCVIPGVCQKKGITYRRFRVKLADGRWGDQYIRLPDPSDPRFAEELARVNAPVAARSGARPGSMAALAIEFRKALAKGWTKKVRKRGRRALSKNTLANYLRYVAMIEQEHGHRFVNDIRPMHVFKIRDGMADRPGKANNYLNVLKLMLAFACERDWRGDNPAASVPLLPIGEHEPWPREVLAEALAEASPMLRLAIVSGLCSGQRISDVILIQHGWLKTGIMELSQTKTAVDVAVPVHPWWREEIAKVSRQAITILYDRTGKPFRSEDRIQERIRRLMHDLGHVDEAGQLRYTFHGLRKNACCYLLELGLSDTEVGAILGMTPETVRHYGKQARALMIAQGAAQKVTRGKLLRLRGEPGDDAAKKA